MKLTECVANGIVGEYGHPSMLYHIVCPPTKTKKEEKTTKKHKDCNNDNDQNGTRKGGNNGNNRNCAKIFALKNRNDNINFSELNCPKIKVDNERAGYMCTLGHLEGRECSRKGCRFVQKTTTKTSPAKA